jgi:hypothetical protein
MHSASCDNLQLPMPFHNGQASRDKELSEKFHMPTAEDLSGYLRAFATTLIEHINIGIEEHSGQVSYSLVLYKLG